MYGVYFIGLIFTNNKGMIEGVPVAVIIFCAPNYDNEVNIGSKMVWHVWSWWRFPCGF
jgi:hypothetical protein